MLTVVKNEIRVMLLTLKYNIMREMLNRGTFILSVIMMILNNASFIVQWLIMFTIKDDFGGLDLHSVMLLWGLASSSFGLASIFFHNAMFLADDIVEGKLDTMLVQPKNVLLQAIMQKSEASAFGDLIYGYIMLALSGFTIKRLLFFTLFSVLGCLVLTSYRVIIHSSAFFFGKIDLFVENITGLVTTFDTYPDIFKGVVRVILYTIIPIAISAYLPVRVMNEFDVKIMLYIILGVIAFVMIAIFVFYKGLKRYSSSNLFNARV